MRAPLWLVARGCTTKQRWSSKARARAARDVAARRHGKRFRVYHCAWCGWWHLATRKGGVEEV